MQTKYRRKIIEQTNEEGAEHTKVASDEKIKLRKYRLTRETACMVMRENTFVLSFTASPGIIHNKRTNASTKMREWN